MFREGAAALVTCAAFRSDIGGDQPMKLRAGTVAVLVFAASAMLFAGCSSREHIDWKSAEAADTPEAYNRFIERHPDSELATQARARIAQLAEDKDWQRAVAADSADAYRAFLAQYANGKWAEEARIRIENFTLDSNTVPPPPNTAETATAAERGESAQPPATSPSPPKEAQSAPARTASGSAPAPAGATSAPAANEASGYGIQLGAFSTQAAALGEWKRLQQKFDPQLHGLFARAVPVKVTSGTLFRLQSPVGDENRARNICAALTEAAQPCVVVLPDSH
jgi:cell division septation protein DedD